MAHEKPALRERYLRLRGGISKAAHKKWDAAIAERLEEHLRLMAGRASETPVVAAYMSHAGEPDITSCLDKLSRAGWKVVFPKTERGTHSLYFYEVKLPAESGVFGRGPFGIREPVPDETTLVDAADIDFVLLPGVAFSEAGVRLGYGGGYYDRWLAGDGAKPVRIGIVYNMLVMDELPRASHDILVHQIVTETGVRVCQAQH
ncbi:5-formyltetrahydrofolate cyclo-ligase [Alicyclobacillus sp. ALC3]|uniref:5-formyltetrahydrofolate cyclo-ligase n=1 Tax=Alicyclobacillus sp. ALC3 TaxID=2796143 RepID=UPI0023796A59|nr:5-formyltetrahydrofolate cyclo-ligase [Alicyclobacillus sp. ALC3]WDL95466.1 5-formyltetrahydrofolate cyclo-ligase [Alicyclobacillus sp. ALC3]